MDNQTISQIEHNSKSAIAYALLIFGFIFILIGLAVALFVVHETYLFTSDPQKIQILKDFLSQQNNAYAAWVIKTETGQIELGDMVAYFIAAIIGSIIVSMIIAFISGMVNAGKGLISLSRNFTN